MQQLEMALVQLAERAETLPTDLLVARLESQLTAEASLGNATEHNDVFVTEDRLNMIGLNSTMPRRSWRGPLVAIVTAATILVITVASVLLLGRDLGEAVIQPAPTMTIPVTHDLFPITLPGSFDGTVTSCCGWGIVSVDDPRLLAEGVALVIHPTHMAYTIGYLNDRYDDVWISRDGVTWEQVALPGLLSEQGRSVEAELVANTRGITNGDLAALVYDIAVGGPGLVAVGRAAPGTSCEALPIPRVIEPGVGPVYGSVDGCIPQGTQQGVVWTSPDGRTWTKLPTDPVFDGADIYGVASDGDSLVAVGFHHELGSSGGGNFFGDSVVWTSLDGITWIRQPHDQELFGGSVMHRLVYGPGGYLAVGWALPRNDFEESIYWMSPDGHEWTRIDVPDELLDTLPTALVADDTGYYLSVAYRTGGGPDWTSPDGITWTPMRAGSFPIPAPCPETDCNNP